MGMPGHKLSLDEFLEWENAQPVRNEFYQGEVVPVADVGRVHGCVVSNLLRHLGNGLQRSPYQVFSQSLQLQIADDTILYPDTRRVEAFRSQAQGVWTFHDLTEAGEVALPSVACSVALADLFDGVDPQP